MRLWVRLNAIRGDETCQRLRMHNAEAALIQSLMTITSNSERTVVEDGHVHNDVVDDVLWYQVLRQVVTKWRRLPW